jgi:spermidine/putrescine transport system substrate-binding protein
VKEPIRSWLQVFRPQQQLHGRIIMINDPRDLIGMALKALGHSMNSQEPDELRQAEALLLEQGPAVTHYGYFTLDDSSSLVTGKAYLAMAFNGDALALQERQPEIRYVVPEEGGSLWTDYLAVAANGRRELAASFIDFLNRPDMAARNAGHVYYATPNRAARALMDEEYLNNPVIFPDAQTLSRCEANQAVPPRVMRRYNIIYSRVTGRAGP